MQLWKYNAEAGETRNGIDYYDCRIVDKNGRPTREYFNEHNRVLDIYENIGIRVITHGT